MKTFNSVLLIIFMIVGFSAQADESKVDKAVRVVKELCLTGKQFDFKADAKGNLTFSKLVPGAEGSVSVNVRNSIGAAAIIDDKIRQIADEDIRNCIKPYIQRIIDAILDEKIVQTEVEVKWDPAYPLSGPPNQLDCACLSVTTTGTDSPPPAPSGANIRLENKCHSEVFIIASKDSYSIPSGGRDGYFKSAQGRYWSYIKLAATQKATVQVGGSWGGGLTTTKCPQ